MATARRYVGVNRPKVAVFARWPEPGKVKTRLIPAIGAQGAAQVYRRLLAMTVDAVRDSGLPFELRVTGGSSAMFHEWLGEDCAVVDQGGGDLGDRLARAAAPGIVIGSDAPGLTPALLHSAAAALQAHETVIGPARDGGYYLLGFNAPIAFAFADMEWSVSTVYGETVRRLAARDLDPVVLPELTDVDDMDDLRDWPQLASGV